MIVCVAANPSIDKLFAVHRVQVGAIHRPLQFVQVPGGKGLNVARAAAALGAEVSAIALLGGHAGAWIAQALEAEGIAGLFAWTEAETRSCLSVSDESGNLTEFYESGGAINPEAWTSLRTWVEDGSEGAGWVILSGSLPQGAPLDGYAELIGSAHEKGAKVALDTRDRSFEGALGAGPDLIKVNAAEAGGLIGSQPTSSQEVARAAEELRGRAGGKADVVITRGTAGAIALAAEGCWEGRSQARGPYPVGSGDAFLAGLITGLDRGEGRKHALALALGAGAANAEEPGAGRLRRSRAEAIASEAEVREMILPEG